MPSAWVDRVGQRVVVAVHVRVARGAPLTPARVPARRRVAVGGAGLRRQFRPVVRRRRHRGGNARERRVVEGNVVHVAEDPVDARRETGRRNETVGARAHDRCVGLPLVPVRRNEGPVVEATRPVVRVVATHAAELVGRHRPSGGRGVDGIGDVPEIRRDDVVAVGVPEVGRRGAAQRVGVVLLQPAEVAGRAALFRRHAVGHVDDGARDVVRARAGVARMLVAVEARRARIALLEERVRGRVVHAVAAAAFGDATGVERVHRREADHRQAGDARHEKNPDRFHESSLKDVGVSYRTTHARGPLHSGVFFSGIERPDRDWRRQGVVSAKTERPW